MSGGDVGHLEVAPQADYACSADHVNASSLAASRSVTHITFVSSLGGMSTTTSTQIHLVTRPDGFPTHDNFSTVQHELPALAEDQVRVQNAFVSVDPYMRGRMSSAKSYAEPYSVGEVMTGAAVGTVVESRSDKLPVDTLVLHNMGWRDIAQGPAKAFQPIDRASDDTPLSLYLGLLGMPGLTAYIGLTRIAELREGESVFVSGAAGAVGTAVGQFARLLGASKVFGSAGSAEKCELITQKYGFDAAMNYKAEPIRDQVNRVIGDDGLDVYFDNVGGDHLEAALDVLAPFGRVAVCGAIGQYNATTPQPGPDNMTNILRQKLKIHGFIQSDYAAEAGDEFRRVAGQWFADGKLAYDETVVEGIEHSVDAFMGLLRGENSGKMVVKI